MNPDSMRKIDHWLRVPLAFGITFWYKFWRFLGFKDLKLQEPPRNILLIELAEMGSTVLAHPALEKLQELHPNANIYFLIFKQNAAAAELIESIPKQNILTIDSSGMVPFIRSTFRTIFACRKLNIDTVINFGTFARFSTIFSYLSGAWKRVGFHKFFQEGLNCGDFLTHKVPYNPHIHTAQSFLTLVHALTEQPVDGVYGKFPIGETVPIVPKRELTE